MIEYFFNLVDQIADSLWLFGSFFCIIIAVYVSFEKRFRHFKLLSIGNLRGFIADGNEAQGDAVSPLKLLFVSIGGMVGIGNIVCIITAITIGGPGALFWVWVAAILGMILKYSEIYLGVLYRRKKSGKYIGGPMYFLEEAFTCQRDKFYYKFAKICKKVLPKAVALMLIVYGVEIFIFLVVNDTISNTLHISKSITTAFLVGITIYAVMGGVKRIANICTIIVPVMVLSYIIICIYVLFHYNENIPKVLHDVFWGAFNGHAAAGGFTGAAIMVVIKEGVSKAIYSADIALGFDASVHSQTSIIDPHKQARLSVWAMLVDLIFCTMSILVVLVTDIWQLPMQPSEYVTTALGTVLGNVKYFMMFFIFTTGWTTVIGWLVVGHTATQYLFKSPIASRFFYLYAIIVFSTFSFADQSQVYPIMAMCGAILFFINAIGIAILRHKIKLM